MNAPPPRLLVLNRRDPFHPQGGGAERYLREVVRGFIARGWEVDWWCSRFRGAAARETPEPGWNLIRRGGEWATHWHGRRWARAHADRYTVILDTFNGMGFSTAGLARSRLLVFQLYGPEFWCAEFGAAGRIAAALERHWLKAWRGRPVATISASTRDDLSALGLRDAAIVPVGLDWTPPEATPPKPGPLTCLYLGRLRATKNPADALRAFGEIRRRHPGARMIVAGTGPEEQELRRQYSAEDVEFRGRVSEETKIELLRRAHLALIPSRREGWNMVVTEAASMGTPSVGYDVRGVRESIRDGETGVLVNAGDWRALGAAASDLLGDRARWSRMADLARIRAAEFTWERTRRMFYDWATL
ncbi:MAG: glycosyltransferase family 4 protein [Kiritimatiellae bacterium]|nr:glycosyltransferase family 4 protein [Kiritimatiellia bacterium]